MEGLIAIVCASIYGYGGLNEFSRETQLWNKRLGLAGEDMGDVVAHVVSKMKLLAK